MLFKAFANTYDFGTDMTDIDRGVVTFVDVSSQVQFTGKTTEENKLSCYKLLQ